MAAFVLVRKDSLPRLGAADAPLAGAEGACPASRTRSVAMGTPHNRELLAAQGYGGAGAGRRPARTTWSSRCGATADAPARGRGRAASGCCRRGRPRGARRRRGRRRSRRRCARTPRPTWCSISVPGEHAAREARRALALGRHVMLFSDNVPLEDEVALKREAVARGLLHDGARLRHRDPQRHAARLRQRRAARPDRHRRRRRHRHPGGLEPASTAWAAASRRPSAPAGATSPTRSAGDDAASASRRSPPTRRRG